MNLILIVGALLGFSSMVMGTYIDHSLSLRLSEQVLHGVATALRYHQLYSLLVCILGLSLSWQRNAWVARAGYVFAAGTILFCSGIYIAAVTGIHAVTYLTPVGGVTLMAGWVLLFLGGLRANSLSSSPQPSPP